MRSPADALRPRWDALIERCGAHAARAPALYERLVATYADPSRAYHTLAHVAHVFAELDAVPLADDAVEWAVWYHDAVYRPGAPDNEARSAALAKAALHDLDLAADLAARVAQLIAATRSHADDPADLACRLFLDADLAILGTTPEAYAAYAAAIRAEHRHLPDLLYRPGRRRFLAGMLDRDRIFLTPHFFARYEHLARANLERELAALS